MLSADSPVTLGKSRCKRALLAHMLSHPTMLTQCGGTAMRSRARSVTLMLLAILLLSGVFVVPECAEALLVSAGPPAVWNSVPTDGAEHPFVGSEYVSIQTKRDKLYEVAVTGRMIASTVFAYLVDDQGNPLTGGSLFYKNDLLSTNFTYVAPSDGTIFLRMRAIAATEEFSVRVAEHNQPSFTGTVRNPKTGLPVEGALVRAWLNPVWYASEDLPRQSAAEVSTLTASDGSYRLTVPNLGVVEVRFDAPGSGLMGEWYDSALEPRVWLGEAYRSRSAWTLKPVPFSSEYVATGIDGSLVEPGQIALKMIRTDTGLPVPDALVWLQSFDSRGLLLFSGTEIRLALTDADGITHFTGDPRLRYVVGGYFVPNDVVLEGSPSFSVLPGESTTMTVSLTPEWIKTEADTRSSYVDTATVQLTPAGNIFAEATMYKVDGASDWAVYLVPPLTIVGAGTHRLQFYSYGYNNSFFEPVRTIDFSVVRSTSWSRRPASSMRTAFGQPVTQLLKLRFVSDGHPCADKTVYVDALADGSAVWKTVAKLRTSPIGSVAWTSTPANAVSYRFRHAGGGSDYLSASVSSVLRIVPSALIGNPMAPASMSRARSYVVSGILRPRHLQGTYPVRIYMWRQAANGSWKSYGYVRAKASDYLSYTTYARAIRLSLAGKWRLRAYAPADSGHLAVWSKGYDYVVVR